MLNSLQPQQWDLTKAAHLLNRAGFGGTPEEIKAFCMLGMEGAVRQVLDAPDDSAQFPKPPWAAPVDLLQQRQTMMALPMEEQKARRGEMQRIYGLNDLDLTHWWLNRMRHSANPFREKMTLFWHGHFATSVLKVRDTYLMWVQNELLRQHAFGNFGLMVKNISRDPAMMIWLDTRQSEKAHPNENFARELMELFTLGIGNYTEQDVLQGAKAFTGYRIDPHNETFRYAKFQHDDSEKQFLGHSGPLTGDDAIDIILQQPACAKFIVRKLWTFYAYEDPEPALVEVLAAKFRESGYEIRPLMQAIFRSQQFYSGEAMRTQIKSPVQWMVQTGKVLESEIPEPMVAVNALRQLGQVPFAPPNVKGWDGGRAWITTSTLLMRYNMANYAVGTGTVSLEMKVAEANKQNAQPHEISNYAAPDLSKVLPARIRSDPKRVVDYLCFRLYQDTLAPRETQTFRDFVAKHENNLDDPTLRELLHLMMSTPQYQLT